jgi:hypothetical protein
MGWRNRIAAGALAAGMASEMAWGGSAQAQTASDSGKVAAEALFEEGRNLVAAGKFAEGCSKFADSQRLDPSPATLLNLANCWEKLDRTATAWAVYREAASAANAVGRKDYVSTAQRRADALAPKLARLTLNVPKPTDGLEIKRDGVPVDHVEWGVAIPIDSGSHVIEASAPGRKPWRSAVDAIQDGAQATVTVPELEGSPVAAPAAAPSPGVAATSAAPEPPAAVPPTAEKSESRGGAQRVGAVVVAGLGVVGLAVGGVFALSAKSQYNDSLSACESGNPNLCNSSGVSQRGDARTAGNVATVAMGAGAAAILAGGVLWFTAPSGSSQTARATFGIAPTIGGVVAAGAW